MSKLRDAWVHKTAEWSAEPVVFLDESGVNAYSGERTHGWDPKGQIILYQVPFTKCCNFNVFPLMDISHAVSILELLIAIHSMNMLKPSYCHTRSRSTINYGHGQRFDSQVWGIGNIYIWMLIGLLGTKGTWLKTAIVGSSFFCAILWTLILLNTPLLALNESSNQVIICWITRIVSCLPEVFHPWRYAPP